MTDEAPAGAEPIRRRAYQVGGSVAVRLPKHLADDTGIAPGTPVIFRRHAGGILIERAP